MLSKKRHLIFLVASLLGTCLFLMIPYVYVVVSSFLSKGNGKFAGLENYADVIENHAFMTAMANTARFIAVCVPVILIISLGISLYIYDNPRLGGMLKTGFLIPMAIPVTSAVLLWRFLFAEKGIVNAILAAGEYETVNWMNTEWAFWILVLSYIWKNLGYNIILWLAALSAIEPEVDEAARVDGAGTIRRHLCVTIPAAKNGAFVIIVLAILSSFKVFREVYLVAGEYPHESIYMIQHCFNNWFRNLEMDKLAAGAVIDSLILTVLILLLQKLWEKRGDS